MPTPEEEEIRRKATEKYMQDSYKATGETPNLPEDHELKEEGKWKDAQHNLMNTQQVEKQAGPSRREQATEFSYSTGAAERKMHVQPMEEHRASRWREIGWKHRAKETPSTPERTYPLAPIQRRESTLAVLGPRDSGLASLGKPVAKPIPRAEGPIPIAKPTGKKRGFGSWLFESYGPQHKAWPQRGSRAPKSRSEPWPAKGSIGSFVEGRWEKHKAKVQRRREARKAQMLSDVKLYREGIKRGHNWAIEMTGYRAGIHQVIPARGGPRASGGYGFLNPAAGLIGMEEGSASMLGVGPEASDILGMLPPRAKPKPHPTKKATHKARHRATRSSQHMYDMPQSFARWTEPSKKGKKRSPFDYPFNT
jgi:hypothetical protein